MSQLRQRVGHCGRGLSNKVTMCSSGLTTVSIAITVLGKRSKVHGSALSCTTKHGSNSIQRGLPHAALTKPGFASTMKCSLSPNGRFLQAADGDDKNVKPGAIWLSAILALISAPGLVGRVKLHNKASIQCDIITKGGCIRPAPEGNMQQERKQRLHIRSLDLRNQL